MLDSQVMDVSASGGWLTRRSLNILGFLICASGLGYAYYAQFVQGFEPARCVFSSGWRWRRSDWYFWQRLFTIRAIGARKSMAY